MIHAINITRAPKTAPMTDRDNTGRFLPGNRYRMVDDTRSIEGISYTRRVNGVSRATVQYLRQTAQGNTR